MGRWILQGVVRVTLLAGGAGAVACNLVVGADDFKVDGLCAPGQKQCKSYGNTRQTCDASGQWQDAPEGACVDGACVDGACTGECAPGRKRCQGLTPEECDPGGHWVTAAAPCDTSKGLHCSGGACVVSCTPGDSQCSGSAPQVCDANGIWQDNGPACEECKGCDPNTALCKANAVVCGVGESCANGACVVDDCTKATDCGVSTECLELDCTNGVCSSTSLPVGTLVDNGNPADCLKRVCDGQNNTVMVPDTTEVPPDPTIGNCKKKACDDLGNAVDVDDPGEVPADDGNACTMEGCNGGMLIDHVPVADGTKCGMGPSCGPVGGGGYVAVPQQVCTAGTCMTPATVPCGAYKCDAGGTACLSACTMDVDCIAGNYCEGATNACKPVAGTGNPCSMQIQCAMGLFCVDGVCCNTQCNGPCQHCNDPATKGTCTASTSGTDPDNDCADPRVCNGMGACASPNGTTCATAADCISGFCTDGVCCNTACAGVCNRCDIAGNVGTCAAINNNQQVSGCNMTKACDGSGNCKNITGQACSTNNDCGSSFCQDGYCCNSSCSGNCAVCNLMGSLGMCTNVPSGQQVGGCNGSDACDGMNNCKKVNGQTCFANSDCGSSQCQDGFCCNSDCAGACAACNIAGSIGTCVSVPAGQQPTGCNMTQACDGLGNCKTANGGVCSFVNECLSGNCVDAVCCNNVCFGLCMACVQSQTGQLDGTCASILDKTDPSNECAGSCNMATGAGCCNGMGACY